jgi:hypothetical protein
MTSIYLRNEGNKRRKHFLGKSSNNAMVWANFIAFVLVRVGSCQRHSARAAALATLIRDCGDCHRKTDSYPVTSPTLFTVAGRRACLNVGEGLANNVVWPCLASADRT